MGTETTIDPNAPADPSAGIFGLGTHYHDSKIIYLPVPWEATTSYGGGTLHGPEAILAASCQLDLFDLDVVDPYRAGLHCLPISDDIRSWNTEATDLALPIKEALGDLAKNPDLKINLDRVNALSTELNQRVFTQTRSILKDGKIPGVIGGDHSVPLGAFQAAAEVAGPFGILHFDAHSDTRNRYMGFSDSHASIMRNAAEKIPQIERLVQVGIRDFCAEELEFTSSPDGRFKVFYDQSLQDQKQSGVPFSRLADEIISNLPSKVWVSFDIDGLDPRYCPHTGTPVPGGLDYSEAILILRKLARSGRKIIGFDVVEVAPALTPLGVPIEPLQASDEWDANVGMRLIYKLSALALASNNLSQWRK